MGLSRAGIVVADDDARLAQIDRQCDDALMLDAWNAAQRLGPLPQWRGAVAQVTAARLATHLGAPRLARRLVLEARRSHPEHPDVWFWYALALLDDRGPLDAWLYLNSLPVESKLPPKSQAELLQLRARIAGVLGDFETARSLLQQVDTDVLGKASWLTARAVVELREDEPKRALDSCFEALAISPSARMPAQQAASILELLDHREQALSVIIGTDERGQAATVTSQRAAIEHEAGLLVEESASLKRYRARSPLLERDGLQQLQLREGNNAYVQGDVQRAMELYRGADLPVAQELVARIESNGAGERRCLAIRGIVQERLGCAPATLAMLARHFGLSLDHVDVADQICYEGTSAQSERAFVERLGWIHREFTLTFETARALIDRGVPVGVVTVEAVSAHMQAVVGYDLTRQTLLIRDPMHSALAEGYADKFFERYRPYGPRAIVILPPDEAPRLNGIELQDQVLYDGLYRLSRHLDAGRRDPADAVLLEILGIDPNHRLSWWARRAIANYDADAYRVQECSEALLRLYPGEVNATLSVLACLKQTGTEAQRRAQLEQAVSDKESAWVFREQLAELLIDDATQSTRVRRLLRAVLRQYPTRARTIALLAQLVSGQNDDKKAVELYRLAACLEPTDRDAAKAYFNYAYWCGRSEDALSLLRRRSTRYRKRSAEPTIALFDALEQLDRVDEAFAVLADATELRHDDGQLWLFAAECFGRYRRFEHADAALARAKEMAPSSAYRSQAAALAETRGLFAEALQHIRAVAEMEPLSVIAHRMITRLLTDLEGPDAARSHLAAIRAKHPFHAGLLALQIEWLAGHDPEQAESGLLELIRLQPSNSWAHRELALTFRDQGRHAEALIRWERAQELAPRHPSTQAVLASLCLARQDHDGARQALRRTLELWPDMPNVLAELLSIEPLASDRKAELENQFLRAKSETINGNLLLEWFVLAQPLFDTGQMLTMAREINLERPVLWASWQVLGRQLLRSGDSSAARSALIEATQRYPYVPALWLAIADTERAGGNPEAERQATQQAVSLNPGYVTALLHLSRIHQRTGDLAAARRVLELGLRHSPRSQALLEALADLEWNCGNHRVAFELLERAILLEPASADGWGRLHAWGVAIGEPDLAQRLARELAAQRPWNAQIWSSLAEVLIVAHEYEQALDAVDHALQRAPNLVSARELKAVVLARIGRMQEAERACSVDGLTGRSAAAMQSRAAWVMAQFGRIDSAIDCIEKVVVQHPDHSWAWHQLIEWYVQNRRLEDADRAARKLVELAPFDPTTHGFQASVQLEAGKEHAAMEALSRALNLKLDYLYAAETLIRLQLKHKKHEEARQSLQLVSLSVPSDFRLACSVEIAAKTKDENLAWQQFRKLLGVTAADPVYLERARACLTKYDWQGAIRLLEFAMSEPGHPEVGALWVRTLVDWGRFPSARQLGRLARSNAAAGQSALRETFACIGRTRDRFRAMLTYVRLRPLVTDDVVWGKVGFALVSGGWHELAVRWLRDYATRPGVEAWMLHNLRLAAMETHRPQLAHRAALAALRLPSDDTLTDHLAFASFMGVTEGSLDGARGWIGGIHEERLDGLNRWLVATTSIIIAEFDSPMSERSVMLLQGQLRKYGFSTAIGWFGMGSLLRRAARMGLRIRVTPTLVMYAFGNWIVLAIAAIWFLLRGGEYGGWAFVSIATLTYVYGRWRI